MKCYKCVRELKVHVVARAAGVGMHFKIYAFFTKSQITYGAKNNVVTLTSLQKK